MSPFYGLVLGLLAVWRITHLLQAEDGPWDLVAHWRRVLGQSLLGRLFDCFYCLSIWVAPPVAWWIGHDWKERLLLWPALSGGAILLERATGGLRPPSVAPYLEDPKDERHGML
jgi:hypothetical protein